jgi:hypothetical protein
MSRREEIISRNPLSRFLTDRGHELRPAGKNFVTSACPMAQHKRYHRPVTIDTKTNLWHCNDCDRGGSVIDWVMIEKNVTAAEAMRLLGRGDNGSAKIAAMYDYTDESGKLLFQCVRFEPKGFKQRQPDGNGGWIWNIEGVRRVLYRLPDLVSGLKLGLPVLLAEGEKDVEALLDVGFPAAVTCNPMGAKKWREEYTETLRGATVFVIADKDDDGRIHAEQVAASLHGKAERVAVVELPDRNGCSVKDISDWLGAGGTVAELAQLLETVPQWERHKSTRLLSSPPEAPQPFPLHCLPPVCEAMASAICRSVRVLESLPGCCILGILSAAIGKSLQVKSGPNRVTRGNLYVLASAESGSGKSETFRHAAKPFQDFEADRVAAWKLESKPRLLADLKILEEEIAKLKKSTGKADDSAEREQIRSDLTEKLAAVEKMETELRMPALSCEDVTGEKLAVLLIHNGEQLASVSPDALSVVNILLGRYNKLDRTDEGIYLKAFTGDRCKVDRQSRESILIESPCLAALWLTQPDKLESLLAERSLSDGGLIPRLLICHTRCEAREIVKGIPEIPASVENEYANLVRGLIDTYRLADEPFTVEPTTEALDALNAHHNEIVKRRRTELRDVTIYAARWNEQAWRVAVVLHAGLHGAHAHEHKLKILTARQAIEIADWYAAQQLEILSASREKTRRRIWDEVFSLCADEPQGIRASDVYRARIVRNADEAHALLGAMESDGELTGRDEQPESGGHMTRIFTRRRKPS